MPRVKRSPPTGQAKLEAPLREHFGVTGARRRARSVRYYDIARQLGILPSRLSEYVRGAYEITWHHQIAICELLRCGPDDILGVADPSTYDLTDGRTRPRTRIASCRQTEAEKVSRNGSPHDAVGLSR
jgi:hypothetical protein